MYEKLSKNEIERLWKYIKKMPESVARQYVFWKWFYDIWFFSDYFLEKWKIWPTWTKIKTPDFHRQIWGFLSQEDLRDLNIIIARWHGKTTSILIYMIWRVLYFPGWSIIYIASQWLGEQWIWKIRMELETNEKILKIFWNIAPPNSDDVKDKKLKKWRQKELEFTNWSYLLTLSKGKPARWQRPREILMDDPQENKDVKNPSIAREFINWAFTSLYNTLLPWWRMCVLWTIVWNLCFVKKLRDEYNWKTIFYEACDENFKNILWKEMWSEKALRERRDWKIYIDENWQEIRQKWIWSAMFNQEYRNIPLNEGEKIIKDFWIRYYNPPLNFDYIIMSIDPAQKVWFKNDFTWITIIWLIWSKRYVIYSKWVKLTPRELHTFVVILNKKFQPNIIVKEANIETKLFEDLQADWMPIKEVRTHKDKATRLLGIAWIIEVWDVFFLQEQTELIEQLTLFWDLEHDDIADSFIIAITESEECVWVWADWQAFII